MVGGSRRPKRRSDSPSMAEPECSALMASTWEEPPPLRPSPIAPRRGGVFPGIPGLGSIFSGNVQIFGPVEIETHTTTHNNYCRRNNVVLPSSSSSHQHQHHQFPGAQRSTQQKQGKEPRTNTNFGNKRKENANRKRRISSSSSSSSHTSRSSKSSRPVFTNDGGFAEPTVPSGADAPFENDGIIIQDVSTSIDSQPRLLTGKTFYISIKEKDESTLIKRKIEEHGGKIIENNADLAILSIVCTPSDMSKGKKAFTKYWLFDCLEKETLDLEEMFYYKPNPTFRKMDEILKNVEITTSQYQRIPHTYITELAKGMGARYLGYFLDTSQPSFSLKPPTGESRKTTHLICNDKEMLDNENTSIVRAARKRKIAVVGKDWIFDCYSEKKRLPESCYGITLPGDARKLGGLVVESETVQNSNNAASVDSNRVETAVENNESCEAQETDSNRNEWSAEDPVYTSDGAESATSSRRFVEIHEASPENASTSTASRSQLLVGKTFYINVEIKKENDLLKRKIEEHGGKIMENKADFAILSIVCRPAQIKKGKKVFTKYWLLDCLEKDTLDLDEIFYYKPNPIFKKMDEVLKNVEVTTSKYLLIPHTYITELAKGMGARYQGCFLEKSIPSFSTLNPITGESRITTHLVCNKANSSIVNAAKHRKISVVGMDWIFDCYSGKKRLPESRYDPAVQTNESNGMLMPTPLPSTSSAQGNTSDQIAHPPPVPVTTIANSEVPVQGHRISEPLQQEVQKIVPVPSLATVEWVMQSAQQESPADVEEFRFQVEDPSNASITATESNVSRVYATIPDTTNTGELDGFAVESRTEQNRNNAVSNRAKTGVRNDKKSYETQETDSNRNEWSAEDPSYTPEGAESDTSSVIFVENEEAPSQNASRSTDSRPGLLAGKTFYIGVRKNVDFTFLKDLIEGHGGKIRYVNADFAILPIVCNPRDIPNGAKAFTKYWLIECLEMGCLDLDHIYYYKPNPKFKNMDKILKNVVVAISQYQSVPNIYIKELVTAMAGSYQDCFTKTDDPDKSLFKSTHLISKTMYTDKANAAKRWNLPVVVMDWVLDCYSKKKRLPESRYDPAVHKNGSDERSVFMRTQRSRSILLENTSMASIYPPSAVKAPTVTAIAKKTYATASNPKLPEPIRQVQESSHDPTNNDIQFQMPQPVAGPIKASTDDNENYGNFADGLNQVMDCDNAEGDNNSIRELQKETSNMEIHEMNKTTSLLECSQRPDIVEEIVEAIKSTGYLNGLQSAQQETPPDVENFVVYVEDPSNTSIHVTDSNVCRVSATRTDIMCTPESTALGPLVAGGGTVQHNSDAASVHPIVSNEAAIAMGNDDGSYNNGNEASMQILYPPSTPNVTPVTPIAPTQFETSRDQRSPDIIILEPESNRSPTRMDAQMPSPIAGPSAATNGKANRGNLADNPNPVMDCDEDDDWYNSMRELEEETARKIAELKAQFPYSDESYENLLESIKARGINLEDVSPMTSFEERRLCNISTATSPLLFGVSRKESRMFREQVEIALSRSPNRPRVKWKTPKSTPMGEIIRRFNDCQTTPTFANGSRSPLGDFPRTSTPISEEQRQKLKISAVRTRLSFENDEDVSEMYSATQGSTMEKPDGGQMLENGKNKRPSNSSPGEESETSKRARASEGGGEQDMCTSKKDRSRRRRLSLSVIESPSKENENGKRQSKIKRASLDVEETKGEARRIRSQSKTREEGSSPYGHQPLKTANGERTSEKPTFPRRIDDNPVFILSSLTPEEKSTATALINYLGGRVSNLPYYDPECTALVTTTLLRSEKVLGCIAAGKYLLKYDYLLKCEKEQQFIPVDETYIWHEDNINQPKGKVLAKCSFNWLKAQLKDKNVRPMSGKRFYFLSQAKDKISVYCRLVAAGGGEVVESLDEANIVIGEGKVSLPEGVEQHGAKYLHNLVLSEPPNS